MGTIGSGFVHHGETLASALGRVERRLLSYGSVPGTGLWAQDIRCWLSSCLIDPYRRPCPWVNSSRDWNEIHGKHVPSFALANANQELLIWAGALAVAILLLLARPAGGTNLGRRAAADAQPRPATTSTHVRCSTRSTRIHQRRADIYLKDGQLLIGRHRPVCGPSVRSKVYLDPLRTGPRNGGLHLSRRPVLSLIDEDRRRARLQTPARSAGRLQRSVHDVPGRQDREESRHRRVSSNRDKAAMSAQRCACRAGWPPADPKGTMRPTMPWISELGITVPLERDGPMPPAEQRQIAGDGEGPLAGKKMRFWATPEKKPSGKNSMPTTSTSSTPTSCRVGGVSQKAGKP